MFVELAGRLLEFLAIVFVVRYLLSNLIGGSRARPRQSSNAGPFHNDQSYQSQSEPRVVSGEMKRDPQCGTYVSTELSLKSRQGGEVLHFCSRQCQETFLQAHSGRSA